MDKADGSSFRENGFSLFKNVFSIQECARFKRYILEEIEKGKEALLREQSKGGNAILNRKKLADIPRAVHKGMLQDIAHRNSIFMDVARDKRLIDCVSPILGPDLVMYRSLSVFKPKDYKSPVGWHQDMSYWAGNKDKISIWISLDNVTRDNGAMRFIPKSHNKMIDDVERQNEVFSLVIPDKYVDLSEEVILEAEIGDVVIFDSQVMHCSGANKSGDDRYTLIFTFQPSSDRSHHREGPPTWISGGNFTQGALHDK
jgi:ectoine hydroxylase-related dioxygenase (phytanoyl-CoA dioxygenase family)